MHQDDDNSDSFKDKLRETLVEHLAAVSPHAEDSIGLEMSIIGVHVTFCQGTMSLQLNRDIARQLHKYLGQRLSDQPSPEDTAWADALDGDRGN